MGVALFLGIGLLAFTFVLYVLEVSQQIRRDPQEPPTISHRIPFLGHAMSILWNGTVAHVYSVSQRTCLPIYTLDFLSARLYVTNDPLANNALRRVSRTVSLRPFKKVIIRGMCDINEQTQKLFDEGGDGIGDGIFIRELDKAEHVALAPGPGVDEMVGRMAKVVSKHVDNFNEHAVHGTGLLGLIKQLIVEATGAAVYGPLSPYASRECRDSFWTCDKYKLALTANVARKIIARPGIRAAETIVALYEDYYNKDGPATGSEYEKARYRTYKAYNVPVSEMARIETSLPFALFPNLVPTSFWTIHDIYSRPELLKAVRAELHQAVTKKLDQQSNESHFTLSLPYIRENCPILVSTFQETQRYRSRTAGVRQVIQDTYITSKGSKYLLKKGGYVQIPSDSVHTSTKAWGDDATTFDPYRFMNVSPEFSGQKKRIVGGTFIPFGYAPSVCPARQFAATEVITFVSMVIMRYELEPISGKWEEPDLDLREPVTLSPPKWDVDLLFKEREQWKGVWNVEAGDSRKQFKLSSG